MLSLGMRRRILVASLFAMLAISGTFAGISGTTQWQEEQQIGPTRQVADNAFFILSDGEHVITFGQKALVLDSLGHQVADLAGLDLGIDLMDLRFAPSLFVNGRVVTKEGIFDLLRQSTTEIAWPDGFVPMAIEWPTVYGMTGNGAAAVQTDGRAVDLPWPENREPWWNSTRILLAGNGTLVLEESAYWRDANGTAQGWNHWYWWDLAARTVRTLEFHDRPAKSDDLAASTLPLAFHRGMLLMLSRTEDAIVLESLHPESGNVWRHEFEAATTAGIAANDHHWAITFTGLDGSLQSHRKFVIGQEDEVVGSRVPAPAILGIGSSGAFPVGKRIAYIDDFTVVMAEPGGPPSTTTWALLSTSAALLIAAVMGPAVWHRAGKKAVEAKRRCGDCGGRLQDDTAFCILCGNA